MRVIAKLSLTLLVCWGAIRVYAQVSDVQTIYHRAQATEDFSRLAADAAATLASSEDPLERAIVRRELSIAMDQLTGELDAPNVAGPRVNAQ